MRMFPPEILDVAKVIRYFVFNELPRKGLADCVCSRPPKLAVA